VVFPDAHHGFDAPGLQTPVLLLGHRLEYNKAAADRASDALREFLGEGAVTINALSLLATLS